MEPFFITDAIILKNISLSQAATTTVFNLTLYKVKQLLKKVYCFTTWEISIDVMIMTKVPVEPDSLPKKTIQGKWVWAF